jgi:hypothetical protein
MLEVILMWLFLHSNIKKPDPMKKKLALLFPVVAFFAFVTVNVADAQSPKTDKKASKVEQTVEKKAVEPCCESKGQATTAAKADCCPSGAKAEVKTSEAKAGCAPAGKACGGCSSKASTQSAEQIPVPKR